MPDWVIDLYVLVTTRVPRPRSLFLFGIMGLSSYTLMQPFRDTLLAFGFFPAALAALLGYLAVVALNLPRVVSQMGSDGATSRIILSIVLAISAAALFAPNLTWVQHGVSGLIAIYTLAFIALFLSPQHRGGIGWFAVSWNTGQRNAANWHVVRLVGLILGNEAVIRFGSPTDWVVAMALGPIALHYLMHWTVIATHPYEDEERQLHD